MVKIALDAMGGDHAPGEVVHGAVLAVKGYSIHVVLVGDEHSIKNELESLGVSLPHPQLSIQHASEAVEMGESPSQSFKRKKDSSIRVGLTLVKEGKADGFVS